MVAEPSSEQSFEPQPQRLDARDDQLLEQPVLEQPDQPSDESRFDNPHLDIVTYNKNALNNMRRAVVLGQGQFSLILARVNYQHLQQVLLVVVLIIEP